MDALCTTDATSFRSADVLPAPALPRRVLRHLVIGHGLGVGSRVLICGDDAERVAPFLALLGMQVETAGSAATSDRFDAVIRLELETRRHDDRSLIAPAAIDQTADLLARLRPQGMFLFVGRVGLAAGSHETRCVARHVATFAGQTRLAVFPDRTFRGLIHGRPGYAVASWQAPRMSADFQHRPPRAAEGDACCEWARHATPLRRAA